MPVEWQRNYHSYNRRNMIRGFNQTRFIFYPEIQRRYKKTLVAFIIIPAVKGEKNSFSHPGALAIPYLHEGPWQIIFPVL